MASRCKGWAPGGVGAEELLCHLLAVPRSSLRPRPESQGESLRGPEPPSCSADPAAGQVDQRAVPAWAEGRWSLSGRAAQTYGEQRQKQKGLVQTTQNSEFQNPQPKLCPFAGPLTPALSPWPAADWPHACTERVGKSYILDQKGHEDEELRPLPRGSPSYPVNC